MRVLVTGGSGFIGRHVVRRLIARGDEVVVADLVEFPDDEVEIVKGDLRDPEVVARAVRPELDAIIHLAALPSVLQSVQKPHETFMTNVFATELLLERCRVEGVGRFVFASTNAVVGNVGDSTIDERIALWPLTPYGATKAACEMLLAAYSASYGVVTVALRFTNIYGAGMQTKDSVIARLMRAAASGGGIEIYGDGEQVRDYLYVTDAARAIELGLALPKSDTVTVGAARSVSMNVLYDLACQATGAAIGAEHIPGKPGEMPAVIVDTTHASELGFECEFDVLAGLQATWADFVERGVS